METSELQKTMTLQESYDQMLKEFQNKSRVLLNEKFKELFDKYPKLESFRWGGWTCYFNDGDECYYSVHEYKGQINGFNINPDSLPSSYSNEGYFDNDESRKFFNENPWCADACREVWKLIYSVPNDILKNIYGDHCLITIKRDLTTNVEDYPDHD